MKNKLSIRHLTFSKLSKRDEKSLIEEMRRVVKKDPKVIDKFNEYNVPLDYIDRVHIEFADLDVSAKTKDKKIYINRALLDPKSKVKDPTHYLAHEITHFLQQYTDNIQGHQNVQEYLDKPTEEEAFSVQIDFKKRNEGEGEANRYTEQLLDHHKLKGKERIEKKKELMNAD